jgi:hypothetical protein
VQWSCRVSIYSDFITMIYRASSAIEWWAPDFRVLTHLLKVCISIVHGKNNEGRVWQHNFCWRVHLLNEFLSKNSRFQSIVHYRKSYTKRNKSQYLTRNKYHPYSKILKYTIWQHTNSVNAVLEPQYVYKLQDTRAWKSNYDSINDAPW